MTNNVETVWVILAEDNKRKGELVGWVAEGSEKGKIVFLGMSSDAKHGMIPGNFCLAVIEDRQPKFLRGYPYRITFHTEKYDIVLDNGYGCSGPLDAAKESLEKRIEFLTAEHAEKERLREQKDAMEKHAEHKRIESILKQWGEDGLKFYQKLKAHDWYYSFSDDSGVWRRGEDSAKEIAELAKMTPGAREIWKMTAPKDFRFPG